MRKKENFQLEELQIALTSCPLFRRGGVEPEQEAWIQSEGLYDVPLSALELNKRSQNALRKLRIKNLGQLVATPFSNLLSLRNLGRISLGLLREEAERYLCRKKNLPLPELGPSRRTILRNTLRAQQIVKLFYTLGTYAAVGRKFNLSRERIRQILERGRERGWIDWEPASKARRKILRKEWSRRRLLAALKEIGSAEQLKNRYHLKRWEVKFLMTIYKVDMAAMRREARLEKTLVDYRACKREFGHDPSSTELFRSRRWKRLLPRIRKIWGSLENFRREQEIQIPQRGGFWTPERTEHWRKRMIAEGDNRRRLRGEVLLNYLKQHGPVGIGTAEKVLDVSYSTAQMILDSLVARGVVRVSAGRRGRTYHLSSSA